MERGAMTRQETARRGCSHAARFSAVVPRYMVRGSQGYSVAATVCHQSESWQLFGHLKAHSPVC